MRAGAFYEDGSPAGESYSNPSNAQSGTALILAAVAQTILQAAAAAAVPPTAVGLALPGHIDDQAGCVRWAPNFGETIDGVFQYWSDVQIREPLEKATKLKVAMGNDANLAALGEYRYGSGRDKAACLVMITLGTGIGGGVVLGPSSVQGPASGPLVLLGGNKGGAELGHIVVNHQGPSCNAGEYGAIEGYMQRDALVQRAQLRLNRGRESVLRELVGGDLGKLTPLHLSQAAARGDEVAIEVFDEAATMLGVGIGNFINIFAPDVVAIGGQIAKAGDFILKPAIREARNVAIPTLFKDAKIGIAEQIANAGMLGAVALAVAAS